ncbi:hypothetical protein HEP87_59420 [Streptomyces sp. S1D4-11]
MSSSPRRARARHRRRRADGPFAEDRRGERRDGGVVEDEGRLHGAADPAGELRGQGHQLA